MLRRPGGLRARRPRHPVDRSLLRRLLALSFARVQAEAGTSAADHRQRAALPDGGADAAWAAERRRFLAAAGGRLSHLFPILPSQSRYNERCRQLAPKLVTLWRAIAYELPGF